MKKIIILSVLISEMLFTMEPIKKTVPVQRAQTSHDLREGIQAYHHYKNHKPLYKVTVEEMRRVYPGLFEYLPESLYQAIVEYVPYQYPTESAMVAKLKKVYYSPFLKKLFIWKALGYYFGLMPYYNFDQDYFYFEQPKPTDAGSILKGSRKDFSIKRVAKMDAVKEELSHAPDPNRDILIAQINKERKEIADSLVTEYKIHLMPSGDLTPVVIKLLTLLKNDPELQQLIATFKVIAADKAKSTQSPTIVIYPAQGKENAQKALNKLYAGLKEIPGSGIQPFFNAKVTDLIWIAQGDSHYKKQAAYDSYFEPPALVYFAKGLTGVEQNYHLLHPETGKELVS